MGSRAKGKTACIIGGCPAYATSGARVCRGHLHPVALQAEIERLRSSHPEGAWRVFRHPVMRRLFELVVELDTRAQPLKGASTEVTPRSRSHNTDDGIVTIGNDRAIPGYAVASYSDSGRLGAALSKVKTAVDQIEGIADPRRARPKKHGRRCGRRSCPKPNFRQDLDSRYCRFCGSEMGGDLEESA